jgi:hypothetical protein
MTNPPPPTPYTSSAPSSPDREALRARIPGWGVDRDPTDRPSVPKESFDPGVTGAHWEFPERQEERWPRERSVEHACVTPVFGTSCPPKGLSGVIRKYAYRRFSEGRAAHWLLLLGADRVDTVESHLRSLASGRPDNPITETGIRSEFTHRGTGSPAAHQRVDASHRWMDPILIGAPWVLGAGAALGAGARVALKRRALRR